jgi:O-antigen ligase
MDTYARPGLYLADAGVLALILTTLVPLREDDRRWESPWFTVPLLALVGWGVLTVPTALSPALAAYTALRWLAAAAVYLAVARGDAAPDRLVTVFMAGLGLHVLIGLAQVWGQHPVGLPGEQALEPSTAGAAIVEVGGTRWLRAYGLTYHPNVLGGFLVSALLLGLPLLDRSRMRGLWWLLWLGLLITFSRSAWLALALAAPLVVGWLHRRWAPLRRPLLVTLAGAALIAALWVTLFAGQLVTRLRPMGAGTERRSIVERGALQAAALEMIAAHPLTGVGAGNAPLAMVGTEMPFPPQPSHNLPLLLAAELGVLGGGLWLCLWLAPGAVLLRRLHRANPWAVAVTGAWLAMGIIGLWDSYPWALNAGRLLTAALLGLVARGWRQEQRTRERASPQLT